MLVLVYGGSGSGKSAFAERLIVESALPRRIYAATMDPGGAEAQARIARHRRMRAGKGFETVERPRDLAGLELPMGCAVLLEDLTNLLANEWFGGRREGAAQRVLAGVERLMERAALTVAVANDLYGDGLGYDAETTAYLDALAALHRTLAARAEEVYEVVCAIAICQKGAALCDRSS